MANEYRLSYTAEEIDERLGLVTELSGQIDEQGKEIKLLNDTINGNEEVVTSDVQLFDAENALVESNLYLNSSNAIVSYNGIAMFTTEINGVVGEAYKLKCFSENIADMGLSSSKLFTSNEIPAVGVNAVQVSQYTSHDTLAGGITLTSDAKYLTFMLWFPNTSTMDAFIEDIVQTLVVIRGNDFPTAYIPYTETIKTVGLTSLMHSWGGKTILWMGTSIPEGKDTALGSVGYGKSYPELVCEMLGANVVNIALGSSMCRANVRTGDYVGGNAYNISRAFTQTLEEKEYLIENWDTVRTLFSNPDAMTTLSDTEKETIRNSSFETRLLPYLDGTKDMPDLFVIDHGNNDHKYTLSDGTTDIGLEPTATNISNGTLAVDSYMTENDAEKLVSVFGDLSKIDNYDTFVASLNRNCYIGAVNFICTLILKYNPRARIVFIGQYDNWGKSGLTDAQNELADSWAFPIVRLWEKLGWRNHRIPGTSNFWGDNRSNDLKQSDVWLKDTVHPHSDTTGGAILAIAKTIEYELRNVWNNSNQ